MLDVLPRPLLRAGIRLSAWLTSDLNVNLPRLGLPRQPFGSAVITSVGMWGITTAYSPLTAYYRMPLLVLIGAVQPRPVALAGSVVVRPTLTLTATFDHRYVDGFQAAQFATAIHEYCAHPASFEPPPLTATTGGKQVIPTKRPRHRARKHAAVSPGMRRPGFDVAIEATGKFAPERVAGLGQPGSASLPGRESRSPRRPRCRP
jgi:hypothetical protein